MYSAVDFKIRTKRSHFEDDNPYIWCDAVGASLLALYQSVWEEIVYLGEYVSAALLMPALDTVDILTTWQLS